MRAGLFILGLMFFSHVNAEDASPQRKVMMAQIIVEPAKDFSLPLADEIEFEMVVSDPQKVVDNLQDWKNILATKLNEETLHIRMSQQPFYTGRQDPKYLQDSFVIDFKEQSTIEFIDEFKELHQTGWEPETLTRFVNSYITEPTYVHGFSIASMVASRKSGDCTEFATLTTALSRALGLPARYMTGMVILEEDKNVMAFGHAWTEVWYKDQWRIMDAALYSSKADKLFYMPASVLDNEGPGFALALSFGVTAMPQKVIGLRNI